MGNQNKGKWTSHEREDGFAFSIREFTSGMAPSCVGKTKRGRINNSAYFIKKAALAWADKFPKKIDGTPSGFTPAVRDIFKAITWSHRMDQGSSAASYESLADAASCHRETVWRAINWLRAKGLIQVQTGRGWNQKERRSLANRYTANFWIFINPETGEIVQPLHHTGRYEWKATAKAFRARVAKGIPGQDPEEKGPSSENVTMDPKETGTSSGNGRDKGLSSENVTMVEGENRQNSAGPSSDFVTPYNDNGMSGANASTASAGAAAASANAPQEIAEDEDEVSEIEYSVIVPAHHLATADIDLENLASEALSEETACGLEAFAEKLATAADYDPTKIKTMTGEECDLALVAPKGKRRLIDNGSLSVMDWSANLQNLDPLSRDSRVRLNWWY